MAKTNIHELVDIKLPAPDSKQKGTKGPYQFVNPYGGEIFEVGSKIAIAWKGGVPTKKVNIYLVDIEAWVVIAIVSSSIPNNGFFQWTIPLTWLVSHNHVKYQFYIEDVVPTTTWTYGPEFKIT